MKIVFYFCVFTACVAAEASSMEEKSPPPQIIGGTEADKHQFPFQASLRYNNKHFCGGSLISKQWVLTARHCFYIKREKRFLKPSEIHVILGAHYILQSLPEEINFAVEEIKYYENSTIIYYDIDKLWNDIALVKLKKEVKFTKNITSIELAQEGNELKHGEIVYITGWGNIKEHDFRRNPEVYVPGCDGMITLEDAKNNNGKVPENCNGVLVWIDKDDHYYVYFTPDALQKAEVPVVDSSKCVFPSPIFQMLRPFVICVGNDELSGCHGDSGGPMAKKVIGRWVQYGVTSFGSPTCDPSPGSSKYTKVNKYIDWIKGVLSHP